MRLMFVEMFCLQVILPHSHKESCTEEASYERRRDSSMRVSD